MKSNKVFFAIVLTLMMVGSCKQEVITLQQPIDEVPVTPSAGNADFTKFIAIGDSFTAGMQAGALYNDGQSNSMAKILATQFATVGGGAFNQPDINHENGFNSAFSSVPTTIRGRLVLFDPDGATDPDGAGCEVSRSAAPRAAGSLETTATCPSTVVTPAMPAPYNTAQSPLDPGFLFGGDKLTLNNFGVPGARIFHAGVANYGLGNPFFGRFASNPSANSMIVDAVSKQGTFFMLYLGNFDILNYATTGAVGALNGLGTNDMTDEATFGAAYSGTLTAMLSVPNSKGVVGTIPDITTLPYFTTVLWNQIKFSETSCTDAATLTSLNGLTGFGGYNAALDGLAAATAITQAEADKRKVYFAFGSNGILIKDETLADLTAALSGINAALAPYGRVRQANAGDLITFAAGGVLGTCPNPPNVPNYVTGVSAPLDDQYVLLPTEIADIQARTVAFNTKINDLADAANATTVRVAVADVYTAYAALMTNRAMVADGVTITPSLAPPTGAFSEDSLHPNSRGYAFTANVFIDAINATFAAAIPKAKLSAYPGTGLPVNP